MKFPHQWFTSPIFICLLLIVSSLTSDAQHILSQQEIQGGSWNEGNEFMVTDPAGDIYIGFHRNAWIGAVIGDTLIFGSRHDTIGLNLSDFFYARLNKEHELQHTFIIDNAEYVRDFFATDSNSFISTTLFEFEQEDSLYPIILGGELEIEREGNRGKGLLIVLDEQLKLEKALIPSTGQLGQVTAHGNFVYMELLIPDHAPYILVGVDTVHNFKLNVGGLDFGFQTVVLCKYDYVNEEVVWWKRIGNVGAEKLQDMIVDSEGNLVIHGWTSSGKFTFSETDTVTNYQGDKPFIGKYSGDGHFIWGILHTDQHGELFHSIRLDRLDNIYIIGQYTWSEYQIGDTILYNEWKSENKPTGRALIIKYDQHGFYQWASQFDGSFDNSVLYDVAVTDKKVIVSGKFFFGDLHIGQSIYEHSSANENNLMLWMLDATNGKYLSHAFDTGPASKRIANLHVDENEILHGYLILIGSDQIFDNYFSSYQGFTSGFLIRLSTEFLSAIHDETTPIHSFQLFPNPVPQGSNTTLEFNTELSDLQPELTIYDLYGRQIKSGLTFRTDKTFDIATSQLMPGAYLLAVKTRSSIKLATLIVQ